MSFTLDNNWGQSDVLREIWSSCPPNPTTPSTNNNDETSYESNRVQDEQQSQSTTEQTPQPHTPCSQPEILQFLGVAKRGIICFESYHLEDDCEYAEINSFVQQHIREVREYQTDANPLLLEKNT